MPTTFCGRAVKPAIQLGVGVSVSLLATPASRRSVRAYQIHTEAIAEAGRQEGLAEVAHHGSGQLVERVGERPAFGVFVEVFDLVSNSTYPIPSVRLDSGKPRPTEAGVGDDDRTTKIGQHSLESAEKLAVGTGTIVLLERKDACVNDDRAAAGWGSGLEHGPSPFLSALEVGPVHREHGPLTADEQRVRDSPVDATEFLVQQLVAEQAIHRLDVVLDVGSAAPASTEQRERCFPAEQQRLHDSDQSRDSRCVPNYCPILEPP
jgi:hypothetical protein